MPQSYLRLLMTILFISGTVLGDDLPDGEIVIFITDPRLIKITEEPHQMEDSTATLCITLPQKRQKIHDGFIEPAYCNVFANVPAHPVIIAGEGTYPPGALIVKSKSWNKDDPKSIELYTVMRKRELGYDPKNGDWVYSIVDGRTRRLMARGTIESCIKLPC